MGAMQREGGAKTMNPTKENPRQENEPSAGSAMPLNVINIHEGVIREHLDEVAQRPVVSVTHSAFAD
ncbi:MAG: hypothetical protein CJBNEKGG_04490 [Prosthecobacter sp.]|nr:hypothetical protein [Prosthecobacter sp.]